MGMVNDSEKKVMRTLSLGATMKTVFWSFFGVRKQSDHEAAEAQLNPIHIMIAGVVGAFVLIGLLIAVVKIVLAH